MRLSPAQKSQLLQNARHVYESYLAYDFFKSKALLLDGGQERPGEEASRTTLLDIVKDILRNSAWPIPERDFFFAGKKYTLRIKTNNPQRNQFTAQLIAEHDLPLQTKLPKDYRNNDHICDLLANKPFILARDAKGELVVSMPIKDGHRIGGPQKYDLYRTHLVTLFNIINKIENEEDISSLLIALATGSGKTYVQALWLEILFLAKFNGLFAIPDNLIPQFRKDLGRLLPDSILCRVQTLRDNDAREQITQTLDSMNQEGSITIASSKFILDNHYEHLRRASVEKTCLVFDEQHLLMANERRRMRLLTLSKQFLSVFLTATPNEETYELSGKKPVAIMSSGQKQKAGQGQFPEMVSVQTEFIKDKHDKQIASGAISYGRGLAEKLILRFDDAIQAECSSAVRSAFGELPYILKRKEEADLRWRLQVPVASKMLCIIGDNESLVNCCHALQSGIYNSNVGNIYHNGNFVERSSVASFFGIPDVDHEVSSQYSLDKKRAYTEQLRDDERPIMEPFLQVSLSERIKKNMFHYLVEYVLSDISGRSLLEHNKLRKQSAANFNATIINQYQQRDTAYFRDKLLREIDAEGANVIAPLLSKLSETLGFWIRRDQAANVKSFTQNWFLDDDLFVLMDYWFRQSFQRYSDKYKVMGVMSGMEEEETPVTDSQPFLGLSEERYSLYEHSGMQVSRAKRRKRTSIELLDDQARESCFTPQYIPNLPKERAEEIADNYFRLGFVGIYVSNKKTEGFSDPNLHTIINLAEKTHDLNNSPAKLIQGIGRARGLDDTVLPFYIHGLGRKQNTSFDLNVLAKDDYYPQLFTAQRNFEKTYIAILGEQVGKDIISWYHQHQDADETIDPDKLKKKVLYLVAASLRQLNIQNSHRIHLSRTQLPKVIHYAMKKLDQEIKHAQRPYQLSLFIRVFGSFVNFICECYFTVLRFKPWIAMFWLSWALSSREARNSLADALVTRRELADKTYLKIIRQAHFKDLVAQGLIAAEFQTWLTRKTNAIKTTVEKSLLSYVKPEIKQQVDFHLNTCLFPLLEKMIVPEKAALLREKLQQFDGIVHFLKTNEAELKTLQQERSDAEFCEFLLPLLHKIPGLEGLFDADIINYPRQAKETLAWFSQDPVTTVNQQPELKEQVAVALTEFWQHQAMNHLGAFFTVSDQALLRTALREHPDRVRAFVDQNLNELLGQAPEQPVDAEEDRATILFSKLNECLNLEAPIEALPQKLKKSLTNYQLSCITETVYSELLPCLVNVYPQQARGHLLAQITRESLEALLHTEQEQIQTLVAESNDDPNILANFFFSRLCQNVPALIDINVEVERSTNYFAELVKKERSGLQGFTNGVRYFGDLVLGSSFGLMSSRVEKILNNEDFFAAISLLLPYHHWQALQRRFKAEPANLKKLANALVTHINNQQQDMTPDLLLTEINKAFSAEYVSVQDYGTRVGNELTALTQGHKTHCATPELQVKMAAAMRQTVLPLLAMYIQSAVEKKAFIDSAFSNDELCAWYVANFVEFSTLNSRGKEQQLEWVHSKINQLPLQSQLDRDALQDPMQFADRQTSDFKNALSFKLKTVFCMSDVYKSKLEAFFIPADIPQIQTTLSVQADAETFVRSFFAEPAVEDENDQTWPRIRATVPGLENVFTLEERLKKFEESITEYQNLGLNALDSNKLSDLAANQMWAILEHPQFRHLINLYMGALTQKELAFIISAQQRDPVNATEQFDAQQDPMTLAKDLLSFKKIINQRDLTAFKHEFMRSPADQPFEFDRTPLKQVLDDFKTLATEVTRCHCYYQQHDEKGVQDSNTRQPAFFVNLSDAAKDIRVPAYNTFMSHFSRKIFFIQGVRNGLPKAGQVFADSHKETIKTLKNIKDNLLRSLWWTTNVYHLVHALVARFMSVLFALKNAIHRFVQSVLRFMGSQASTEAQDTQRSINEDYVHSAFTVTKKINELTPLSSEQVAQPQCPKDVITHVEHTIHRLPGHRMRMFAQTNLAQQEALLTNNQAVPIPV